MEHDLVLEGRVVLLDGLADTEIGITDGRIAGIGHGLRGSRRINTGRCLIFPGFVDIHVHLREPGWERKEDFRTGTLAAVHGGVTTVADMPNNPKPTVTATAVDAKRRLVKEKAVVDVQLYGGVVESNLGRLNEMAEGVAGFKVYLSETTGARAFPEGLLVESFKEIAKIGKPVSVHCERQSVLDRVREGLGSAAAYPDLRPPSAEVEAVREVVSAMDREPTLTASVCHASVGETVAMLGRAQSQGKKLSCEATLHHIYFSRRAVMENMLLKTNPPLRSEEDRASLLEGLRTGAVSFLVTDHAPHLEGEKLEKGLSGVPGLDDYAHVASWLIREQGFDPTRIATVTSSNPARYLGLRDRGQIAVGMRADLSVIDIHSPETVDNEDVMSKCGWSPYKGREFPGRARWTIRGGDPLMDDFEIAR